MTPIDATPTSVLFDLAKRHCGVSHKELAGLLLSGRPLSDGRSPQSRLGDRTWVSRFIVHAPAGTLSDSYFCDYAVGALRFAARMKSRSKRALTGEAILDIVCGKAGRAMDDALKACGQSPTLYRNMMERIACEGSLTADERAEGPGAAGDRCLHGRCATRRGRGARFLREDARRRSCHTALGAGASGRWARGGPNRRRRSPALVGTSAHRRRRRRR